VHLGAVLCSTDSSSLLLLLLLLLLSQLHCVTLQFAFFHLKGRSGLKHTNQLLECWRSRPELPTLTVVGKFSWNEVKESSKAPNIVFYPKVGLSPAAAATVGPALRGHFPGQVWQQLAPAVLHGC